MMQELALIKFSITKSLLSDTELNLEREEIESFPWWKNNRSYVLRWQVSVLSVLILLLALSLT
jgi:hypothetical protein